MDPLLNKNSGFRKQYFENMIDKLLIIPYSLRKKLFIQLIKRIEGGEIGDIIAGDIEVLFYNHIVLTYKNKILKYTTSKPYFSFSDIYKMLSSAEKKLFTLDDLKAIFQETIKKMNEIHIHVYRGRKMCYKRIF